MKTKLPETEVEYRAFLDAQDADPVKRAQIDALLAEYEHMPCTRRKRTPRPPDVPDAVRDAIRKADHTAGWNNRPRTIRRFDLAGGFGHGCTLYVVPYRRFAYNRQERATAAYWRERGTPQGGAA